MTGPPLSKAENKKQIPSVLPLLGVAVCDLASPLMATRSLLLSVHLTPVLHRWHAPAAAGVKSLAAPGTEFNVAGHAFGKTTLASALWDNSVHSWLDFSTAALLFVFLLSLTVIVSYGRVLVQEEAALAALPGAVGERRERTG